jgi:hypothetical protein
MPKPTLTIFKPLHESQTRLPPFQAIIAKPKLTSALLAISLANIAAGQRNIQFLLPLSA